MGIGSFLKREVKNVSSGISAQDGVQDWAHAARVFTDEDMLRSPKFKGMFHVKFIFNDEALAESAGAGFRETIGSRKKSDVLSVLTKSVDLPSFNMDYTTHNQYNKTTHTYKKLKFEPVSITFHDDMSDIVWGLWAFYYAWYFAEGAKGYRITGSGPNKLSIPYNRLVNKVIGGVKSLFRKKTPDESTARRETQRRSDSASTDSEITVSGGSVGGPAEWDIARKFPLLLSSLSELAPQQNWSDAWGLNGSIYYSSQGSEGQALPLLTAIEIYPLGNKQASVIVLHNPKIIGWDHDNFDYSAKETATCKMKLVYDGVSYERQVSAASVLEDVSFYDRHPSSLMRGTPRALLGPGGILDRAEGVIGNILNGEFGVGDLINVVGIARSVGKKGFSGAAKSELKQTVKQAVTGAVVNKIFPGSR